MKVAIVGCGVVGRGWLPVFARAGCQIRIYDSQANTSAAAQQSFLEGVGPQGNGRTVDPSAVKVCRDLESALADVDYVQESLPEDLEQKRSMFTALDSMVGRDAYLASSTSSLDINEIARDAQYPDRCFTVHPFNPASLLSVVEVLSTVGCGADRLAGLNAFLTHAGQLPIVLKRYIPGYIGNRLQAAVMREALHLVANGITDADGIDGLVSNALALRWLPLGIFGTNHTNDDQGLLGYYAKFWQSYQGLMATLHSTTPQLDEDLRESIATSVQRRFQGAPVSAVVQWRDRVVQELRGVQLEFPFLPTHAVAGEPAQRQSIGPSPDERGFAASSDTRS